MMNRSKLIGLCTMANTIALGWLALASFYANEQPAVLEAEKLRLTSEDGSYFITIGCDEGAPKIVMSGLDSKPVLSITGGSHPEIAFQEEEKTTCALKQKEGYAELTLGDFEKADKISIRGGGASGLFLKNTEDKVIGTWTLLSDGGAGFGLADHRGFAASILRGGKNPSISFFSPNNEPMAAMGMIQQVPHLLISSPKGSEGILMHGGNPASMLFVDELGKVKILISKNGVFQGPNQEKKEPSSKRSSGEKVFSMEDQTRLFPEMPERSTTF